MHSRRRQGARDNVLGACSEQTPSAAGHYDDANETRDAERPRLTPCHSASGSSLFRQAIIDYDEYQTCTTLFDEDDEARARAPSPDLLAVSVGLREMRRLVFRRVSATPDL